MTVLSLFRSHANYQVNVAHSVTQTPYPPRHSEPCPFCLRILRDDQMATLLMHICADVVAELKLLCNALAFDLHVFWARVFPLFPKIAVKSLVSAFTSMRGPAFSSDSDYNINCQ